MGNYFTNDKETEIETRNFNIEIRKKEKLLTQQEHSFSNYLVLLLLIRESDQQSSLAKLSIGEFKNLIVPQLSPLPLLIHIAYRQHFGEYTTQSILLQTDQISINLNDLQPGLRNTQIKDVLLWTDSSIIRALDLDNKEVKVEKPTIIESDINSQDAIPHHIVFSTRFAEKRYVIEFVFLYTSASLSPTKVLLSFEHTLNEQDI